MRNRKGSYRLVVSFLMALSIIAFSGSEGLAEPKFVLTPGFTISEIYDDNIIPYLGQKDWDFYTAVEPYFDGRYFLRFGELTFGYHPSILLFPRHFNDEGINEVFHNADFGAKAEFANGLILIVRDKYYTLPFSYSQASFNPSNIGQSNEASISSEKKMDISQTIDLNMKSSFSRFDASGPENDGIVFGGQLSFTKYFNSLFSMGLVNMVTKYYYDSLATDPFIYGVGLKPQWQMTSRIKGIFPFGYRFLKLGGVGDDHSISYNVRLEYEEEGSVILTLFFNQEFLVDLSGNSFDRRSFGLEFNKKIARRLRAYVNTAFSTYNDKSQPGGAGQSVLAFNPGFEFELGRDFWLEVGYNGFYNKWGSATSDVTNNRFFISFNYEKGKSEGKE